MTIRARLTLLKVLKYFTCCIGGPLLILFLFRCAAHPTIADRTLKQGETFYGYTLSLENVFPVLFYRYGLTDISDVGFRLGLPIYGSGIDYSRVLFESDRKRDVLNLGWSLTPNSNLDFTYYKFSYGKKQPGNSRYWGLRGMYIPNGLNGGQSVRLGILFGMYRKGRIGFEMGYFHDFASMPITQIFTGSWDENNPAWKERYSQFPHVSEGGIPTEHSRITGLSLRLTISLSAKKEEELVEPEE